MTLKKTASAERDARFVPCGVDFGKRERVKGEGIRRIVGSQPKHALALDEWPRRKAGKPEKADPRRYQAQGNRVGQALSVQLGCQEHSERGEDKSQQRGEDPGGGKGPAAEEERSAAHKQNEVPGA